MPQLLAPRLRTPVAPIVDPLACQRNIRQLLALVPFLVSVPRVRFAMVSTSMPQHFAVLIPMRSVPLTMCVMMHLSINLLLRPRRLIVSAPS